MSPTGHRLADGPKSHLVCLRLVLVALSALMLQFLGTVTRAEAAGPSPTPEPDPLAVPTLPDNPSPIDLGRVTYYYHCMPCHGDKGQGLTDEWRAVWVDDHQNCWSRGCHAGKPDDEGFPIPRYVPPVMPPFTSLARFGSVGELSEFLHTEHPPQNPGVLDEADCDNVAAYLTRENPQSQITTGDAPVADTQQASAASAGVTRAIIALVVTLGLAWLIGSREPR
jgi:mono/diheme cytochrome c family protein